jgi:hypothetical protein
MKKKIILALLFYMFTNIVGAQKDAYFTELIQKPILRTQNCFISYDTKVTTFYNTPSHLLKKTDPAYTNEFEETGGILVAKYKSTIFKDSLHIIFDMGASDDPNFLIYTKDKKRLFQIYCLQLCINANGTIYTAGHTNNMYNCKRKFQLQKDKIVEVKQPFNYVGVKGITKKAIVLYQDKVGSDIVANVSQNSEIEILLAPAADNDQLDKLFLVKTKFGLVGWLRIAENEIFGAIIEELFFAGD